MDVDLLQTRLYRVHGQLCCSAIWEQTFGNERVAEQAPTVESVAIKENLQRMRRLQLLQQQKKQGLSPAKDSVCQRQLPYHRQLTKSNRKKNLWRVDPHLLPLMVRIDVNQLLQVLRACVQPLAARITS